jgi:2-polyprenyl-6-hydroxyphenyl methylase/3-demethylubiquinone-9 3-methyltransferase
VFINLDDLADTLASLGPAKRILEIGCGDGSMADRLCAVFPQAEYVGIDVAPEPGRRFTGDRSRAEFRSILSSELAAEQPEPFDLVVVVDVLHHVLDGDRAALLGDAASLTRPGGIVAVKDWERDRSAAHALCYGADRYVSGDTTVRFMAGDELRDLVQSSLVGCEPLLEARVPPRRNNVLIALRRH